MSQQNRGGTYNFITNESSQKTSSTNTSTSTTTGSSSSYKNNAMDIHSQSWKLPYSIEDEDLTFNGKPLNMLAEEASRRCISSLSPKSRGRSRQTRK